MLSIAIAGAGLIGQRHIELVQANPNCRLAAIVDPAPAAKPLANNIGVPYFESLDELLACTEKPDAIILATPNQLHVEQALACIAAGIATLIEKPVAHTLAEGERLLEAVERAEVPVLVGHHRLHSSAMAYARDIVRKGALGTIVGIAGTALFYKAENEGYFDLAPWRKQPGGGPILINMIHEIGNFRALCGEIVEVQAMTSNAIRQFPVEDTAAISLRFGNGALGTFLLSDTAASSKSWEHTSGEDPRFDAGHDPNDDCYVVSGTMGSLSIPTMRLKTYPSPADRSWHKPLTATTLSFPDHDPMVRQLEHFCEVARRIVAPIVSVRDGLNNLRVIDAIGKAAKSGASVRLD